MALYVLFENENTFLFLYFIWLLLNLKMCQIILPDPGINLTTGRAVINFCKDVENQSFYGNPVFTNSFILCEISKTFLNQISETSL